MLGTALLMGAAQPADLQADSRLNQRLTLYEAGTPLSQLFHRIENQTSVVLRAAKELAPRRAILYAPERCLREIMTHLATAFGAEWRTDGGEPPAYTLVPLPTPSQPRSRRTAQNLREQIQSLYTPEAYSLSDELDDALQAELFAIESERRAPLQLLAHLNEAELNTLRAGKTLEFSSRTDPRFNPRWLMQWKTRLKEDLSYLVEVYSSPKGDMKLADYYASVLGEAFDASDEIRLRLTWDPETGALECALGLFYQGQLVYGETFKSNAPEQLPEGYEDDTGTAHIPPNHPWARVVFPDDLQESFDEEGNPQRRPVRADETLVRPLSAPPLEGDWFNGATQRILQVAKASGKPFAAEFYWNPTLDLSQNRITDFVRALAAAGYKWLSAGDWVIMCSKDRTTARWRDVPPDALARWFFKPYRRGILTVDNLVEIGDYAHAWADYSLYEYLVQYGVAHRLVYEGELPHPYILQDQLLGLPQLHHGLLYALASLEPSEPGVLEAWSALSPSQRRALAHGQAIPLAALSPKARQAIYALWGSGDPARTPAFWSNTIPQGNLSLHSREEPLSLFQLPSDKARAANTIETALQIWDELYRAVDYEYEQMVTQGWLVWVCCLRAWTLRVTMGESQHEYVLFHDYSPLIQRGKLPATPQ
ncbi:MAG: hypothetical protein ACK4NB_02710 [Fimbriimonadales bacterium]